LNTTIAYLDESAAGWQRSLYAFLAEKQRRSGSNRTVESYSRMQGFFGCLGKPPDQVTTQDVFAWAYGVGLSCKDPSSITIGARIACLSSFYRFLMRMKVVAANPCDAIERPRMPESSPRGLSAEGIQRLLAALPKTPVGLRDRAIILTLTFTGRRRAEVLGMTAGSITVPSFTPTEERAERLVSANFRSLPSRQFRPGSLRWARTWRLCRPTSHSGPTRATAAASPAGPFTQTSDVT